MADSIDKEVTRGLLKPVENSKTNLALALEDLNEQLLSIEKIRKASLEIFTEKHLGLYTEEQEADEIAVGILADLNINPEGLALGLMRLGEANDPKWSCRKDYQTWKETPDGMLKFRRLGIFAL